MNPLWKNEDLGHVVLLSNVGYITPVNLNPEKTSVYFTVFSKDGSKIANVAMNPRLYEQSYPVQYSEIESMEDANETLMSVFDEYVSNWHHTLESQWQAYLKS